MSVFKAYDVRGRYPSEINADMAYNIGRAFVIFTKRREIIIGMDARPGSELIFRAVAKGVAEQGADVIDIGLCSTPMLYFACAYHKKPGIMVTASHLARGFNGFKFCNEKGMIIYCGAGSEKIEKLVSGKKFATVCQKGSVKKKSVLKEYQDYCLKKFWNLPKSKLRIVIDSGNMMGMFDGEILKTACNVVPLFSEIDGKMPNHECNPMFSENTLLLRKRIKKEKADFGIIFDGDADRVLIFDENGSLIAGDILLGLLAEYMVKPGDRVAYEVRTSWAVEDAIKEKKGIPLLAKAGNPFVKQLMIDQDAILGGEKSGHYFFRDSFFVESPLGVVLMVLKIVEKEKRPLSEIVRPLMKYFNSGEINFTVKDQDKTLQNVEHSFKKEAEKILHIDGVSVYCKDFWFNIRKSNTEPLVRLNIEAKSRERLEEVKQKLVKIITS